MGRPKHGPDRERSTKLTVRCRPAWLAWLEGLAAKGHDPSIAAMVERLAADEARRLKHDAPPPR